MRILGLICLENKRHRADLILVWKIINGIVSINPPLNLRQNVRSMRSNSIHLLPAKNGHPKTNLRYNSFYERIVNNWNSLPEEIVTAPSNSTFKGRLDKLGSDKKRLPRCSCDKPDGDGYCIPSASQYMKLS